MTDRELLRHYWIVSRIEDAVPFYDAPESMKRKISNTIGYTKYALKIRGQELLNEIRVFFRVN